MKCGGMPNQHDHTASAGQMVGTRSQVSNHSAAGPTSAEGATSVEVVERIEATPESVLHAAPLRAAQPLLGEKRSGKLIISKEDLEQYVKGQYMDAASDTPLGSPGYVPHPDLPKTPFDTSPPRLCEIREALWKARSGSAPGPNSPPYKMYKNCPQVTKIVWNLIRVVWKKKSIPAEWKEAVGIFIPKEQNSTAIRSSRALPC
ncbi:hypothetical protein SRHO_G00040750 [Serrasalmus rhombeus]